MSDVWVDCTTTNDIKMWINLSNVTTIEQSQSDVAVVKFDEGNSVSVKDRAEDILNRARVSLARK